MSIEAYPLHWPAGRERTRRPKSSNFRTAFAKARDNTLAEIQRFGGKLPIISTNLELRRDGIPYANRPQPADRGVAVYFTWQGEQYCFACDTYDRIEDNMHAIGKTIEAMRAIERWGASDAMRRAFSGFKELPTGYGELDNPFEVLNVDKNDPYDVVRKAYRELCKVHHPDVGGNPDEFRRVQTAWENICDKKGW